MGLNFSSCTSRFRSSSSSASSNNGSAVAADDAITATAPNSAASALPKISADAAKVLLVDGTVLKFKSPVKVMKVLIEHPQHLICPLDSLKPGVHSLSSMMPDDDLKLGHLYLLLPSKAFRKPGSRNGGTCVQPETTPDVDRARRKTGSVSGSRCVKTSKGNNILIIPDQKSGRKSDHHHHNRRVSSANCAGFGGDAAVDSRQVAHHHRSSEGLRRCRTWAPRLQPIEEAHRSGGNS